VNASGFRHWNCIALTMLANVADLKHRILPASPDQAVDTEVGSCCGRRCKIQAGHALAVAGLPAVEALFG
jgi:hypothetical protein